MDTKLPENEKAHEGNIGFQRKNSETACKDPEGEKSKPGRRQKEKPVRIVDADQIKLAIDHFFPAGLLNKWVAEIEDPRSKEQCTYGLEHLFWLGVLLFLFRLQSRRQLVKERETESFYRNLLDLSGSSEKNTAHPDTVNHLLEGLDTCELEELKVRIVKRLIQDRRLEPFRFSGAFRVALDGTGLFSFSERHCEHCLKTEHSGGAVTYSHKMMEAKLVSETGFALSVCSESIENENGFYEKQDCELKAFYRMEKRLKASFPRTPLCLLLDGLYACSEVLKICEKNFWDYFIVFKSGSIPNLYKEAIDTATRNPHNSADFFPEKNIRQKISWAHSLKYGKQFLHVIFCEEFKTENGIETVTHWAWLTNIRPDHNNVFELVNKGGRQRWKIENQGFNDQKRHDFELEHLYGHKTNAWKNYYQLLQIAHIITQLIIYGDLCMNLQKHSPERQNRIILPFLEYYQSIRNFVRRLAESFRNSLFSELAYTLTGNIQIRFPSG